MSHTLLLLRVGGLLAGDCDNFNPMTAASCQIDVAQYGLFEWLASMVWLVVRVLLGAAYWVDAVRVWLIATAFSGAYDALAQAVGPLLGPMATLALMLGALALIALPITGASGPVNVRSVLVWCLVGPPLLTLSGPYLAQFEQIRVDIGAALVAGITEDGLPFAGVSSGMAPLKPLYPSAQCGLDAASQPTLQRFGPAGVIGIDEQVAALVWADAQDIHCPNEIGPQSILPDQLFVSDGNNHGYFFDGNLGDADSVARQSYLRSAKQGINLLLLALLPALVALLVAMINLVFACCAVLLWCALPLGLLFSFFQPNSHWFTALVRRGAGVLRTSWTTSLLVGIFVSLLGAAAQAGDALRYTILVLICGVFLAKLCAVAFGMLGESLEALSTSAGIGGGPRVGRLATHGLAAAAGAATGGVAGVAAGGLASALTYRSALAHTGSHRYAAAASAGRFRPLMQLGEVAASMGVLDDRGDTYRGMRAGRQSAAHPHAGRETMRRDALHSEAGEPSLRERALERSIAKIETRLSNGQRAGAPYQHQLGGAARLQSNVQTLRHGAEIYARDGAERADTAHEPAQVLQTVAGASRQQLAERRRKRLEQRLHHLREERARLQALRSHSRAGAERRAATRPLPLAPTTRLPFGVGRVYASPTDSRAPARSTAAPNTRRRTALRGRRPHRQKRGNR